MYKYMLLWPDYGHFFTLASRQIRILTDTSLQLYQIIDTGEQLDIVIYLSVSFVPTSTLANSNHKHDS